MKTRILLADDHRLVREGLRTLLERAGHEIVGEAADGRAAVELAAALEPELVLLDVSMPRLNGIEAARAILAARPSTRIVMLSMHDDLRYVVESLRAGALGYLLKDAALEELLAMLPHVLAGRICLHPAVSGRLVREFLERGAREEASVFTLLSPREREVLQLIAEGRGTREIADGLHLSVKTVESHRAQIREKLGLGTVADLTRYALKEGLIRLD